MEFIAPNPNVEVAGSYLMSIVYAAKRGAEMRLAALKRYGISDLKAELWYPLQPVLKGLRDISAEIGDLNMMLMGKDVALKQELPPISSLKEILSLLNVAHHLNHRLDGKIMFDPATGAFREGIGTILLAEYDEEARHAVIVDSCPYSIKNVEGYLYAFVEKFRPADSTSFVVKEDLTKERKTQGDSSTFLISW